MRTTPYKGYALYEPDASPDLTESGEYNTALMAVDADMHDEEQARIEGDTALNIAIANEMAQRKASDDMLNGRVDTETSERKAADTALGNRIDNAEVEISANSADLTGIKGLTYGDTHVNFLEHDNGSYSSPALNEISEHINQGIFVVEITSATTSLDANTLAKLKASWPKTIVVITDTFQVGNNNGFLYPLEVSSTSKSYIFIAISPKRKDSDHRLALKEVTISPTTGKVSIYDEGFFADAPYWNTVHDKPFSTIGSGLKVESDALTVDASALPSALTIMKLSEFGELTVNDSIPGSATGNGNAAAFAKLQQAWPSVIVVDGGTTWMGGMYIPSSWTQTGYTFTKSCIPNSTKATFVEMNVGGSGYPGAVTLNELGATA